MIKKLLFVVLALSSAVFTTKAANPCFDNCFTRMKQDKDPKSFNFRTAGFSCLARCRTWV